jgi:uncharacterized membrane protein YczE/cytidylate kinase
MHIFFISAQIILLRKDYQKIQLLQILVSFLFGFYTDLTMYLTSFLIIADNSILGYGLRLIELLCGGAILAGSIASEVHCDVLMLAGEGFPLAIAKVTKKDFGKVKIFSDTGLVCIGIALMYYFFHKWSWEMIGIGTLISMFYVGFMVRFFSPHFNWLERFFANARPQQKSEYILQPDGNIASGSEPLVITIAREYGSGGRLIGEQLAQRLNLAFFDREIIDHTALELGYSAEFVAENEQNIQSGKLWEFIFTDNSIPPSMNPSHDDAIFVSESRAIRELSQEKSCIIIGRLANWVLRDHAHCFSVFIESDQSFALKEVMQNEGLNEADALKKIDSVNRGRANHYWKYTHQQWTNAKDYDLVVNTSKIGIEGAVELIAKSIEKFSDSKN